MNPVGKKLAALNQVSGGTDPALEAAKLTFDGIRNALSTKDLHAFKELWFPETTMEVIAGTYEELIDTERYSPSKWAMGRSEKGPGFWGFEILNSPGLMLVLSDDGTKVIAIAGDFA